MVRRLSRLRARRGIRAGADYAPPDARAVCRARAFAWTYGFAERKRYARVRRRPRRRGGVRPIGPFWSSCCRHRSCHGRAARRIAGGACAVRGCTACALSARDRVWHPRRFVAGRGGVAANVSYLTAVVPAHALSEVSRDNQYSLSTIVSALGAPDATAVLVGGIAYVVALVFGVIVAARLARNGDPAYLVLIPPAIALLGGSFVHTVEIAAAVPAAFLLCTTAYERSAWLVTTLVLLAVPWMMATSAALFLAPFFPIAYLVAAFGFSRSAAYASALASFAGILLLFALAGHPCGCARRSPRGPAVHRSESRRGELATICPVRFDESPDHVAAAAADVDRARHARAVCDVTRVRYNATAASAAPSTTMIASGLKRVSHTMGIQNAAMA